MNWKSHPIIIAKKLIEIHGDKLDFHFSIYIDIPLSLEDKRKSFWLTAKDVNDKKIDEIISNLDEAEELSFNSSVRKWHGAIYHIPMIDFVGPLNASKLRKVNKLFDQELLHNLVIFKSGRSYHGYVTHLMSERDWQKYMGTLLLLNRQNKPPIIDHRWIGHRLRGEFTALRWSSDTDSVNYYPKLVGNFFSLLNDFEGSIEQG